MTTPAHNPASPQAEAPTPDAPTDTMAPSDAPNESLEVHEPVSVDAAEAEIAPAAGEPEVAKPEPEAAEAEPEAVEPEVAEAEPAAAAAELELDAAGAILAAPEPEAEAEPGDQDEGVLVSSGLPDLTEDEALHAALEALLLVVDSPAEVELLADALDQPVKRIRQALNTMAAGYAEQGRGIDLRDVGGGWRFYTRDIFAPFVEKLLLDGQRAKLTRAALESLAVIAYRQPVTRARVAAVRGVNVDGVIRTLLARGLIEETGTDKDTGGILYRTTELFLERLGLSSLEDLPPIAPLLPEVDAIDDV